MGTVTHLGTRVGQRRGSGTKSPAVRREHACRSDSRPSGTAALAVLCCLLLLLGALAPVVAPYDPLVTDYASSLAAPSLAHPMGCDVMGRDVLSRIIWGVRTTLWMSVAAVAVTSLIGTLVGTLAAFCERWVDTVLMRVSDAFQAFPALILGVAVVGILGPSIFNALVAVVTVTWVRYARLVRSLVLDLRQSDFIVTERLSGLSTMGIVLRHVLPNIAGQVVSMAIMDVGLVMLTLASFSFLGLGVQAPTPEWGGMLSDGRAYFQKAPWLMAYPGLAILVSVTLFNLLGDRLSARGRSGGELMRS